jgi:hypothetical protein
MSTTGRAQWGMKYAEMIQCGLSYRGGNIEEKLHAWSIDIEVFEGTYLSNYWAAFLFFSSRLGMALIWARGYGERNKSA